MKAAFKTLFVTKALEGKPFSTEQMFPYNPGSTLTAEKLNQEFQNMYLLINALADEIGILRKQLDELT